MSSALLFTHTHPAESHFMYVRNFIQGGKASILNKQTLQLAFTKDKVLIPVNILVQKIGGIAEDTLFIGLISPVPKTEDSASLWLSMDGTITYACSTFEDWFGYSCAGIINHHISALVSSGLNKLLV
jgi:hypothetical protein